MKLKLEIIIEIIREKYLVKFIKNKQIRYEIG